MILVSPYRSGENAAPPKVGAMEQPASMHNPGNLYKNPNTRGFFT
jgi:hypothetical protein